jgi:formylmethanofuran dehydrogenase subunit B
LLSEESTGATSSVFQAAIACLQKASRIRIGGHVVTVDGSRAVISLAEKLNAFVDIDGSESAFRSIRAVQRAGMITASLSEVRFRSDVIVMIGDDRLLQIYPRLPERFASPLGPDHLDKSDSKNRRMVFLGNWSRSSLARFELLGFHVTSLAIDLERIPQLLYQWSRLTEEERLGTSNFPASWIANAEYLSIVWSAGQLDFAQPDLWIERVYQWIGQHNEKGRCVGFPLSTDYMTFQQVCTWTTGFPGRVQFKNGTIEYQPLTSVYAHSNRSDAAMVHESPFDLEIRIDETLSSLKTISRSTRNRIHIAPCSVSDGNGLIYLPSGIAGVHYDADFFRTDGTVVLKVIAPSNSEPLARQPLSASSWLRLIREAL